MKHIKTTATIITSIAITALLILSCGGGGGESSTPLPPTQSGSLTASNAAPASGAVITTINLMIEPSYIGTASYDSQDNGITKKSFLNALLNQAIQNIKETQTKTTSGTTDTTTTCTGGGTKKETSNWSGSDSDPENYTGTITYTNCKEGTSVWNGTTSITYQGTYQNPTKITTLLNSMTYTDTNTNLSLSGLTITYNDIAYSGNNITSASAAMTGNINGTINSKAINASYNNFKIAYSFSGNNMNITLSGNINPVCVNSELTVTTNTTAVFTVGSRCPASGDITITDNTSNAKMSFTSQGGMSVQFNDQTTASYTSCSQSEGFCL